MANTQAHSNKTQLKDRILWYDGDSTVSSEQLIEIVQKGNDTRGLFVEQMTDQIKDFNRLVSRDEQISVKTDTKPLDYAWNIPQEYQELDVVDYLTDKLIELADSLTDEQYNVRVLRVGKELARFRKLNLENVLRAIIYIINTLDSKKVVWGVGRGSSVSSYVLYLIGVHNVDSVEYDLHIDDFLRM